MLVSDNGTERDESVRVYLRVLYKTVNECLTTDARNQRYRRFRSEVIQAIQGFVDLQNARTSCKFILLQMHFQNALSTYKGSPCMAASYSQYKTYRICMNVTGVVS